jgi:hypothetical protein
VTSLALAAPIQQAPFGPYVSLESLFVLAVLPFLVGGLVLWVVEDLLGRAEYVSFGAAGVVILGLAALFAPEFDGAVALAIAREFGWRIGLQVGRPLTLYWGVWGVLMVLAAYDEWPSGSGETAGG